MSYALTAIAFDPGSIKTAYAMVETRDRMFRFLEGGHLDNISSPLLSVLDLASSQNPCLPMVVVEQIQHDFGAVKRQAVLDCKGAEQWMVGYMTAIGGNPIETPAAHWRKILCGQRNASTKQIKIAVEAIVSDLRNLKCTAKERVHIYDAIGLAVVAIAARLEMALTLPVEASEAIAAIGNERQEKANAKRAAKRAAKIASRLELGVVGGVSLDAPKVTRKRKAA